jgi:PKD repeat protein
VADLAGGNAGLSINSTSCGEGSNGAENGTEGITASILALPMGDQFTFPSLTALSGDTTVCTGTLVTLTALSTGSNYNLQWQRLVAGSWSDLVESPDTFIGTQTDSLQIQTNTMQAGSYRLVLLPEGDCFAPINSLAIEVSVLPLPTANPSYLASGNEVAFSANTSSGSSWIWTFAPGQSSTEENPTFVFSEPGEYPVTLSVANECGSASYELQVSISEPLVAQISNSSNQGCAPLTILFEDLSTGTIENRTWTFPGGQPATSTEPSPLVVFSTPGTYNISLSVNNSSNSASSTEQITVVVPPTPSFEIITNNLMISLQNNSLNATSYFWNFGDGNTSSLENPVHTYSTPGVYEVSLNASNNYCGVANAQTINVTISGVADPVAFPLGIHPNPTSGWVYIEHWQKGELALFDPTGRHLSTWQSITNSIDMSAFSAGLYFLRYSDGMEHHWFRLIKQ